MAELPVIQPFLGDSWDECSTLIHNVRNAAYREGKIRDKAWMADLASIHFMGEALAWYARLPEDVQEDWSKLQAALANRWSNPEGESRCASCSRPTGTGPQDAAVPEDVAAPAGKSGYLARGVLKAVNDGSNTTFYAKVEHSQVYFLLTQNVNEAARFRFEPQSTSTLLELVNPDWYQWVAIHWCDRTPDVRQGSTPLGAISRVNPETMKSPIGWSGPFQVAKFRLLPSGQVVPVWRDGKTETDLKLWANGSYLFLSPDINRYRDKALTLYIQKIEE